MLERTSSGWFTSTLAMPCKSLFAGCFLLILLFLFNTKYRIERPILAFYWPGEMANLFIYWVGKVNTSHAKIEPLPSQKERKRKQSHYIAANPWPRPYARLTSNMFAIYAIANVAVWSPQYTWHLIYCWHWLRAIKYNRKQTGQW